MINLLNNRYHIIEAVGMEGGFGTTFLAEDICMPSHQTCALKQLKPVTDSPEIYQLIQQRFKHEATVLEDLGKTNSQIPKLYAYFEENGYFYLVQEWIEGQTLTQKVTKEGPLSDTDVKDFLINVLPILTYIHSKGKIHRDIKPDNIILRKQDNKPILIDFGAVKEVVGTVVNSQGFTTSSIVIGTPGYMPLEQASGRPQFSSDLYSLSLTAIYLLTGKMPHEIESDPHTGHLYWEQLTLGINPDLATVLNKAIQPLAQARYTTAKAMQIALTDNSSANVDIPPTTLPSQPVPPTQQIQTNNYSQGSRQGMGARLLIGAGITALAVTSTLALTRGSQPLTASNAPLVNSPTVEDQRELSPSVGTNTDSENAPQSSPSPSPSTSTPSPQNSNARFVRQIRQQLESTAMRLGQINYRIVHDPHIGNMPDNNSERHTLQLRSGYSYALAAVCDEDCGDIDLKLYDANGNTVVVDEERDDTPLLEVIPRSTGEFTLEVIMPNCAASNCYYGVGLFEN